MNNLKLFSLTVLVSLALTNAASATNTQKFGADRHVAKSVACTVCHQDMSKPAAPEMKTCLQCHPVEALVKKTEKVKPANPHTSPHYGNELECTNCHMMHAPTENYCAQCHNFDWKVP